MSREIEPDFGDAQDEIRWLRDGLSAERKRREGLEDEIHLERLAHTAAVTRAEQAERERDAQLRLTQATLVARERAEADNATKDKAFSEYVYEYGVEHLDGCPEDDTCECPLVVALNEAFRVGHPGATLLERMRATQADLDGLRAAIAAEPSGAEKIHAALVAAGVPEDDEVSGFVGLEEHVGRALERMRALEKVRELLRDGVMGGHIVLVDECRELSEACKAADAMKETP